MVSKTHTTLAILRSKSLQCIVVSIQAMVSLLWRIHETLVVSKLSNLQAIFCVNLVKLSPGQSTLPRLAVEMLLLRLVQTVSYRLVSLGLLGVMVSPRQYQIDNSESDYREDATGIRCIQCLLTTKRCAVTELQTRWFNLDSDPLTLHSASSSRSLIVNVVCWTTDATSIEIQFQPSKN